MDIVLIPGDGIGPEITRSARFILDRLVGDINFNIQHAGRTANEHAGSPLPQETIDAIDETNVALKGPVATPVGTGYRSVNVALRKHFQLYANVRPAVTREGIEVKSDVDFNTVIIRENTEGAYSNIEHTIPPNRTAAESTILITKHGAKRICHFAFEYAQKHNRQKVTLVHKANILKESNGLFLDVGREIAMQYDNIQFNDVIVDAMCTKMVINPDRYDVIVTTNLFGDILSDLAAGLSGGLGIMSGANIGEDHAVYEPVHGTAPDIAGDGKANPTAILFSAATMLDDLDYDDEANALRNALEQTLRNGEVLTPDRGGTATTQEFTHKIMDNI